MTRTNTALVWVIAILATALVAGPAAAADGYESLNSVSGDGSHSQPYRSLNSVTGIGDSGSDSLAGAGAPATVNAILADSAPSATDSPNLAPDAYRSLTSVVGDSEPPASVVEVREANGFDWGDAGIGALVTLALAMTAFAATRLIGRSRRPAVESRA